MRCVLVLLTRMGCSDIFGCSGRTRRTIIVLPFIEIMFPHLTAQSIVSVVTAINERYDSIL